jgi:crotonobetaine/carnitine-CoA ligase
MTTPQHDAVTLAGHQLEATTIGELVALRSALGDKPLLHVGDDTVSYAEAHERSDRLAAGLAALGVERGNVVATLMYNSTDHLMVWFACAKLGAVWAPVNVSAVNRDLVYALADSGAAVLVIDPEFLEPFGQVRAELPGVRTLVARVDAARAAAVGAVPWTRLLEGADAPPQVEVHPLDPMAILYTGGSTGMPKGVLVPHLYYFANAVRYGIAARATSDDVHFGIGHFFHGSGQHTGLVGPMYAGMTTSLARWFSASAYWDRARAHGATVIDPIGPLIAAVVRQPPRPDDRDHSVRVGIGAATRQISRAVRDEFEQRFGVPLLEAYAQTETGTILTFETLEDHAAGRGSNGRPREWVELRILDDRGLPVPAGTSGEICYRMSDPGSFMLEYWHKPEETVAAWRGLWFHTGDVGHLDADGYLHFTGRQAHWIRRRGENVSSFEVERTVEEHLAVATCAAVGVPADLGDEDIKVYVQLLAGHEVTAEELAEHCAGLVSYYKVPRYIEFVEEFPRSMAKQEIERHTLRARGIGAAWDREAGGRVGSVHAERR